MRLVASFSERRERVEPCDDAVVVAVAAAAQKTTAIRPTLEQTQKYKHEPGQLPIDADVYLCRRCDAVDAAAGVMSNDNSRSLRPGVADGMLVVTAFGRVYLTLRVVCFRVCARPAAA